MGAGASRGSVPDPVMRADLVRRLVPRSTSPSDDRFPGYGGQDLAEVSWDEWFTTFDDRDLEFVYQETNKEGRQSNFFRLTNPHREDA